MNKKLEPCKICGKEVSAGAKTCPNCGEKSPTVNTKGYFGGIIAVILIGLLFAWTSNEPFVDEAEKILTIHYINNKIYYPVICKSKKIENKNFILCSADNNNKIGGLYLIENEGDRPIIYMVNGKAFQHAENSDLNAIRYTDPVDIQTILGKF